jgi:imidazolonepropionase-like amidohydrolase
MFECVATGFSHPQKPSVAPTFGCRCHSPAMTRFFSRMAAGRTPPSSTFVSPPASLSGESHGAAAGTAPATPFAFENLRLFDGKSQFLRDGLRVVVEGKTIRSVEPLEKPLGENVARLDCGGRTLTPGLIDAHYHVMMAALPLDELMGADIGFINFAAAAEASRVLMRGFTSIRDMAGPCFGLKRAIDSGLVPGPRIWPSGAMITQTAGHGDYRRPYEIPAARDAPMSHAELFGVGAIADGVSEVLRRAREQLLLGASQLKLAGGGGVISNYDPIDVSQYTSEEFRAAVDAAGNWGTYVTVHAYTPRAIKTAIRAGVRCVEHGQLMDEDTAKEMADSGAWLSIQPFLDDEDALPFPEGSSYREKQLMVSRGTDLASELAKKHGIKTAWGADILFDRKLADRQGAQLAKMTRWHEPAEVLRMTTSVNAELLQMAGPRSPYGAPVGVVEAGAFADLLLVDGDPLAQVDLLASPEQNLLVIMKDGLFYKNILPRQDLPSNNGRRRARA